MNEHSHSILAGFYLPVLFVAFLMFSCGDSDNSPAPAPVSQNSLVDRITIEGSGANAKLVLTTDPTDAGLYFKFGSVVGIYSGHHANAVLPAGVNSDTFDSGDVAFDPTETATYDTWSDIPYTAGEIEHTLVNVKAGKGDPCRLVSYTAQQVKDAADVPDNGIWRLPTNAENQEFSGQTDYIDTSVHWWAASGSPFNGVAGGEFPSRDSGGVNKFLPAAGSRLYSKGSVNHGSYGSYWSSTPFSVAKGLGYYMNFHSTTIYPNSLTNQATGLPVRCVRQ